MKNPADNSEVPPLEPLIMTLRGHRVILDAELARLYGVTTKALNQALKRNINRFPSDFAFQLIPEEVASLNWSQFVTGSDSDSMGRWSQFVTTSGQFRRATHLPWVFTEHGALMAANILKNDKAAEMSVYVVRAFIRLRQIVLEHEVLARRVSDMEVSLRTHGEALVDIYEKLEPLLDPPSEEKPERRMGFGKA